MRPIQFYKIDITLQGSHQVYGVRNELLDSEGDYAGAYGEENDAGRPGQAGVRHSGHYSQVREWDGHPEQRLYRQTRSDSWS